MDSTSSEIMQFLLTLSHLLDYEQLNDYVSQLNNTILAIQCTTFEGNRVLAIQCTTFEGNRVLSIECTAFEWCMVLFGAQPFCSGSIH